MIGELSLLRPLNSHRRALRGAGLGFYPKVEGADVQSPSNATGKPDEADLPELLFLVSKWHRNGEPLGERSSQKCAVSAGLWQLQSVTKAGPQARGEGARTWCEVTGQSRCCVQPAERPLRARNRRWLPGGGGICA